MVTNLCPGEAYGHGSAPLSPKMNITLELIRHDAPNKLQSQLPGGSGFIITKPHSMVPDGEPNLP